MEWEDDVPAQIRAARTVDERHAGEDAPEIPHRDVFVQQLLKKLPDLIDGESFLHHAVKIRKRGAVRVQHVPHDFRRQERWRLGADVRGQCEHQVSCRTPHGEASLLTRVAILTGVANDGGLGTRGRIHRCSRFNSEKFQPIRGIVDQELVRL